MRANIPLIIAVGGCIFFGFTSIWILNRSISIIDSLSGLNITMGYISYKKGCIENTSNDKNKICNKKALDHKNDLIYIHKKVDSNK
jgi:hypothetical protein